MLVMAKKNTEKGDSEGKPKRGRPATGKTPTYNIHTNISIDIGMRLERYMSDQTYEPKLRDVIERALQLLFKEDDFETEPDA